MAALKSSFTDPLYLNASSICSSRSMLAFSNAFASKSKSCTIKNMADKRFAHKMHDEKCKQETNPTYHDFIFILDVAKADFAHFVLLLGVQPVAENFHHEGVVVLLHAAGRSGFATAGWTRCPAVLKLCSVFTSVLIF